MVPRADLEMGANPDIFCGPSLGWQWRVISVQRLWQWAFEVLQPTWECFLDTGECLAQTVYRLCPSNNVHKFCFVIWISLFLVFLHLNVWSSCYLFLCTVRLLTSILNLLHLNGPFLTRFPLPRRANLPRALNRGTTFRSQWGTITVKGSQSKLR